ncbi:MAG: D-tyrosyl-tRNA(Tyr) deacylase [Firmicutes bacterium]|nr:D-tyrosyl-tRNA(Tyr) deacylase [Bacillota bacterium]
MRAVVQRVSRGAVSVDGAEVARIGTGFVVLLGVGDGDTEEDAHYIAEKVAHLRVFEDAGGKMNLAPADVGGEVLLISQFTLYGDVRKGRRPSYSDAARPDEADRLYRLVASTIESLGVPVKMGVFQAMMLVEIHNDGPVTILLDSRRLF